MNGNNFPDRQTSGRGSAAPVAQRPPGNARSGQESKACWVLSRRARSSSDPAASPMSARKAVPVLAIERAEITDLEGRWVTPGLVDCHTTSSMAATAPASSRCGWMAPPEEVARAGGGVVSSVKATNALSVDGLVATSLPRLDTLLAGG